VYFNRALDAMYAHLTAGAPLPPSQVVRPTRRGAITTPMTADKLPPLLATPAPGDRVVFEGDTLTIPE
jgi:hydroxybutyrate-dimer hydrolase